MRLRLAAYGLGIVAFAACGNDYDSDNPTGTPDGGTSLEGGASSSSGGHEIIDAGSGPFKEEENLPCDGRTANDAFSLYVAPSGVDNATCGTREAPCKTIQTGFANALVAQKPKVLIGAGTYVEALALDGGLTLEGGWDVSGSTWTPNCGAGHSAVATIQTPDTSNISIQATRGATVLRFLTIKSKPTAAPGESLIGLVALGPDVKVAIDDTSFIIAGGGKGADGAAGVGVSAAACSGGNADGADGPSGSNGKPPGTGSLSSTGFSPGTGDDGAPGFAGNVGTAAPLISSYNYDRCDPQGDGCALATHTTVPIRGDSGCGGGGGSGGKAGSGGGSSIGILATDALIVTYGGSVTTGAGGEGGAGGAGVDGADGTPGKAGQAQSIFKAPAGGCGGGTPPGCGNVAAVAPGGDAGGVGGKGGNGGRGAGGAGGWSISFAKFGTAALLASTTTVFTTTIGGKGGAPNGPDGLRQQQWP